MIVNFQKKDEVKAKFDWTSDQARVRQLCEMCVGFSLNLEVNLMYTAYSDREDGHCG